MNEPFATLQDIDDLWRPLTDGEKQRAEKLLPVISDSLRQEARKLGRDIDKMIASGELYDTVAKSVTVDVLARTLMTPTDQPPLSQYSQTALGYTVQGTFLVPGGGLFIKKSELARLGLRRQRIGAIELYDSGDNGSASD